MCSTPYGIRGLGTISKVRHKMNLVSVLNALRHQRFGHAKLSKRPSIAATVCSTPYGIRGLGTIPCVCPVPTGSASAQRLAASEVWAPGNCRANSHSRILGAQRLTASEVWTQTGAGKTSFMQALCSTPYGIRGLDTHCAVLSGRHEPVLNALRHQRFGYSTSILPDRPTHPLGHSCIKSGASN